MPGAAAHASSRESDGVRLSFGERLVAPEIDRVLGEAELGSSPSQVTFDLSSATFVDPTALLYLCACAYSLHSALGAGIRIELPESKKVRDLMRRYRFGAALHRLLGGEALDLVTDSSAPYLQEEVLHYAEGLEPRVSSHIAALTVTTGSHAEAMSATATWSAPQVTALLERYLGLHSQLVAPAIVREALLNAVLHPNADHVVSNGFLQPEARGGRGLLTIAFWDNGEGIPATLASAAQAGKVRDKHSFELYYDWYALFEAENADDEKSYLKRVYSGEPVDPRWPAAEMLLASTFPGVSRDPSARTDEPSPLARYGPDFDRRGMGLYILTSTAINSLGGEVLIRSNDAFVNIKRAPKAVQEEYSCHYRAGIVHNPVMERYFRGNHVVVRLPLLPGSA